MHKYLRPNIILGATGQVGEQLEKHMRSFDHMFSYNDIHWPKLDLLYPYGLENTFLKIKPQIIFICAAQTNVDAIELDRKKYCSGLQSVNIEGVANVINACRKLDFKPIIVFYSTDYVFDGFETSLHDGVMQLTSGPGPYDEDSEPNPLSEYGRQKLYGEELLKQYNRSLIIRTTWVYGQETQGKNFAMRLIKNLSQGNSASIPDDEFSTPTYSVDLARYSFELANQFMSAGAFCEIFNIAGTKTVSKYQWALDLAETFGLDKTLIHPVKSASLNRAAERPLLSGLNIRRLKDYMIDLKFEHITSYEDNLKAFKAEYESVLVKEILE